MFRLEKKAERGDYIWSLRPFGTPKGQVKYQSCPEILGKIVLLHIICKVINFFTKIKYQVDANKLIFRLAPKSNPYIDYWLYTRAFSTTHSVQHIYSVQFCSTHLFSTTCSVLFMLCSVHVLFMYMFCSVHVLFCSTHLFSTTHSVQHIYSTHLFNAYAFWSRVFSRRSLSKPKLLHRVIFNRVQQKFRALCYVAFNSFHSTTERSTLKVRCGPTVFGLPMYARLDSAGGRGPWESTGPHTRDPCPTSHRVPAAQGHRRGTFQLVLILQESIPL